MKFKLLFLILIFAFSKIFATGQEPDKIFINNKEYDLLNNPLEKFFDKNPDFHPIYGKKLKKNIQKDTGENQIPISTSNYRGYIATFKIENNSLKVIDLKIQNINSEENQYISVFKELFGNLDIDLDYSGILIIPIGKFIDSDNFGYSYLYAKYKLMTIQKDSVIKEKDVNADDFIKFKKSQFQIYLKTEDYKLEIKSYLKDWKEDKKWDLSKEQIKDLSKVEIKDLQKQYKKPPNKEYFDGYLFLTKDIDFIIADY